VPSHTVAWSDEARAHATWLAAHGVELTASVERALSLGARPNAYRRIRARRGAATGMPSGGGFELAVKEWRVWFDVSEREVHVQAIRTGYKPRELATNADPALDVARAFVQEFPAP
jgi:hypothetical protein